MEKHKINAKYNILSIRVTNVEKEFLNEMICDTLKNISILMRDAMYNYTSIIGGTSSR